jgi:hypothetical protein
MAVAHGAVVWIGCLVSLSPVVCLGMQLPRLVEVSRASGIQDEQARFDIPPQPLVTALRNYSETTGVAVLFDDGLTAGRMSGGVRGTFKMADALQQLLAGTGLKARYASRDAFTLTPDGHATALDDATQPSIEGNDHPSAEVDDYARRLQASIENGLCGSERTRPGRYRLALQLWIGVSGMVERVQLLDTVGSDTLDAEIVTTLRALPLDPPPVAMSQPVTLLLRPRPLDAPYVCPGEDARTLPAARERG